MNVNIAVCGKFHFGNYIKYVNQYGLLGLFFYSHRLSTNSFVLSVPEDKIVNIWIKEYLLQLHIKMFNKRKIDDFFPIYHDIWESLLLFNWAKCNIFHIMINGNGRKLIERAHREGSFVIGDAVSSHPNHKIELLREEYERLGIKNKLGISKQHQRLLQEIETCDYLLVPSHFVKNSYIEQGFDANKIHLIPFGVDLDNFYPLDENENNNERGVFRVLCVAQITPRKGQVYLLEAWKKLNLPNSELLLIGHIDNDMIPILSKYEGCFKHISSVPHLELCKYYRKSSVFVLPSIEEAYGLVVAEAMACGLPIIVTTNTGASEIIEHEKQGFIIPIRSSDAMANFLELLYLNQKLQHEMSKAALMKSKAALSWEQYAVNLCSFYKSIYY